MFVPAAWGRVNLPYNQKTALINEILGDDHDWTGTQTFKAITIDSTYFDVDAGGATTYGTSGNSTFSVDGAGNVVVAGNMGIRTASPSQGLEVINGITVSGDQSYSWPRGGLYLFDVGGAGTVAAYGIGGAMRELVLQAQQIQFAPGYSTKAIFTNTGILGINTSFPNTNTKLDVAGLIGAQSGVSVGATSPISGLTSFVCIDSGVSPVGSMTRGAIFYSVNNEMWVNDGNGTHTQISPHDPETGELYVNSYNVYTGKGEKYYPKTGKIVEYTVEKISPEIVAKTEFVKAYVADVNNASWVTIPEEEAIDEDKKLKGDCRKDELTGLFEKRIMATSQQAEKEFKFNWLRMPKFVRNAWGK